MKLGSERGIKTGTWFSNEILRMEDINFVGEGTYQNLTDLMSILAEQGVASGSTPDMVMGGLLLEWSTALTSYLRVGMTVSFQGYYLASDGSWGFQASGGDVFAAIVPKDQAVAVDAGGTLDRIDVVEIRPIRTKYDAKSRQFKDPITEVVTSSVVDTKYDYGYEFQVLKGVENASPVAPTHTAGWIKLAEVYVAGSVSSIVQADIKDVRDSDLWTTEANNTVYKKPFIGEKVTSSPTGGTATSLDSEDTVSSSFNEILTRLRDLSGVQDDAIKERHIDWGTSSGQVSAEDVPHSIADIFTTKGDIGIRGTTIPERLAAGVLDSYFKAQGAGIIPIYEKLTLIDTGIKIAYNTRQVTGAQVITGVGFKPSTIIFFATDGDIDETSYEFSTGFADVSNSMCLWCEGSLNQMKIDQAECIRIQKAGSHMKSNVSALGSDGFTLTWSTNASMDVHFIYLCLP